MCRGILSFRCMEWDGAWNPGSAVRHVSVRVQPLLHVKQVTLDVSLNLYEPQFIHL